jgi:ribonuclease R
MISHSFDDYRQANRCLPGDTVLWKGEQCSLVSRAAMRPIVGLLELHSKFLYGHTSRGVPIYLFHPLDKAYPPFRVGCSFRDTSAHQIALIQFDSWELGETYPRGTLIRLLGPSGTLSAELEALQWLHGRPDLKQKQTVVLSSPKKEGRLVLSADTWNIDPEGCKDIDDCLSLRKVSDTVWELIITIADVAETVLQHTEVDRHAAVKGQTLYSNGTVCVPMLPPVYSENLLSLLPGEERLGLSLSCLWNTVSKELTVQSFQETVLTNQQNYTYETVKEKLSPDYLTVLRDSSSYLKGSLTDDPHEWIEEFMIFYNKTAAAVLQSHKTGILRSHKAANQEALEQFLQIHPDLRYLAFESAKYAATNETPLHATLGSVPYCHCTSPIRRYADLVNQRCLKAILAARDPVHISQDSIDHLNFVQKQQKLFERRSFFLQTLLSNPTGYEEGFVVSSTDTKTKLYIPRWKQLLTIHGSPPTEKKIHVQYYTDVRKPAWADRVILTVSNTGSQV